MAPPRSLRGPWHVRLDPENKGIAERWWEHAPDEGWILMDPVGPWQHTLGPDARGVAWYRRTLPRINPRVFEAGGRAFIRFESVATECEAWVRGVRIGEHTGDFVPFDLDATDALRDHEGRAELMVRIDQHHAPRPAPGVLTENGHITKGFHDVLSLQHAGIWGGVSLRCTGDWSIPPGGIWVDADPADGRVRVRLDLRTGYGPADIELSVRPAAARPPMDRSAWDSARTRGTLEPGATGWEGHLRVPSPELWSLWSPTLYTLLVRITRPSWGGRFMTLDLAEQTFGFRDVRTGGPENRRVLLNGSPLLIRGVLDWGHEPAHIAPAPTHTECVERFRELKARGFNCVCCCMVYLPEHFYRAADEVGMLIWQEHPVWKSRMGPEWNAEYRRLYEAFFRRDAAHPSVVIVSGACEHEAFDKDLAAWWWGRSREMLPRTLRQVQTAFFAWSDPGQTDLYDEHTYDNSGRWVEYVKDVRAAIDALPDPRKPFIMGETILSNAWPSPEAIRGGHQSAWWRTRGLRVCREIEDGIARRYGAATLERFRRQAHAHALTIRAFQSEVLRTDPDNAGWVMNHLRDVPACRCGFLDELDRWRYSPEELVPFLADAALLCSSPGETRGLRCDLGAALRIGWSNFTPHDLAGEIGVITPEGTCRLPVAASAGSVSWAEPRVILPPTMADRPLVRTVRADLEGGAANQWRFWAFPKNHAAACQIADVPPYTRAEREIPFEERGYSSGWGLPVKSWSARWPDPVSLFPAAPVVHIDASTPTNTPVVTRRVTNDILDWIERGGRALVLASQAEGGLDAKTLMQWSGVPFVVERGPLVDGDSDWVADLLHHDLTKRFQRAVPTGELGLADTVSPLVRFFQTHDSGVPKVWDLLFAAPVGSGVLAVSTLDHAEHAGAYLLNRVMEWLAGGGEPGNEQADSGKWASYLRAHACG